jgi:hypothetical protein
MKDWDELSRRILIAVILLLTLLALLLLIARESCHI